MNIYKFGERLITTGDLDPVYIALVKVDLTRGQLARVLVAYWMFYHLGVAAWLSEQKDFWGAALTAAENIKPSPLGGRWPRGVERRHYRGKESLSSVRRLAKSPPEELIEGLAREASLRGLEGVLEAIGPWPLFGPWIGFKIADMLERCAGVAVSFPDDICLMYQEPAQGLSILAAIEGVSEEDMYLTLRQHFRKYKAPPRNDRRCGVQEIETILCKWKSMRGGHYYVGKDILEVRHGLKGWGGCARRMLECMPKPVELF